MTHLMSLVLFVILSGNSPARPGPASDILIGTAVFSDFTVSQMMSRESDRRVNRPIIPVFDSAFPWERYLSLGDKRHEFSASVISDSERVSGRSCYRISFRLDEEGDSVSASGKGRIWMDRDTYLRGRTWRDHTVDMKRGKAEVKTFSDFGSLKEGLPVLLRSESQTIPRFLYVGIESIRITIKQSDFKLE